jgi:predicted regulator of Ras-like GTPase activity (Roadblock/LC7/MglB family)
MQYNEVSQIEEQIDELFSKDGINECGIITMNGTPVIIRSSDGLDPDVFSALCATIYGAAANLKPRNHEDTVEVRIRNGKNDITINRCGRKTLLAVVKDKCNGCPTCVERSKAIRNVDANDSQV